jgi:hypothetical protein
VKKGYGVEKVSYLSSPVTKLQYSVVVFFKVVWA